MTRVVAIASPMGVLGYASADGSATIQSAFDALPESVRSMPVVCIRADTPVMRADWGQPIGDAPVAFVQLPLGGDGGGVGKILSAVATIAISILAPVAAPAVAGALSISTSTATAIVTAVGTLAIGGIANALVRSPTAANAAIPDGAQASATYTISPQGNSARLYQPIPCQYGRHLMVMDFAADPYAEYVGNDQYLYQIFSRGCGEYEVEEILIENTSLWTSSGGFTGNFEDVEIEIIEPGETATLFPGAVINSAEVGGQDIESTSDYIGPYVVNDAARNIYQISVDFVFPGGLYYAANDGGLSNISVTVRAEARLVDEIGAPAGAWVTLGTHTYSGATATAQRYTESYAVTAGRYEVRVIRISEASDSSRYGDTVQWSGLRGFVPDDNAVENVSRLAVKMRATGQLTQISARRFRVIQTRKIPTRSDGSWTAPVATRSIAWAAADMLRNDVYGAGRSDSQIDIERLEYLDGVWSARGDYFDGIFDTKRGFWEALRAALLPGRAEPVMVAGMVSFVRDEPASIRRCAFTPRNILPGSFEPEYVAYDEDTPEALLVEYWDSRTWSKKEVLCALDGADTSDPDRRQIFGVTNRAHAWREGMGLVAAAKYRRIFASLGCEFEGRMLLRGDAVAVSHDVPGWGASAELVSWEPISRTVIMDEPVASGQTIVGFSNRRGALYGPVEIESIGADGYSVTLDAGSLDDAGSPDFYTGGRAERTRVMLGDSSTFARNFKILEVEFSGDHATVALIIDAPEVYTADEGDPPEETATTGPGNEENAPVISGAVTVALAAGSLENPVTLVVSWPGAAGATSYVVQVSPDGSTWSTAATVETTQATITTQAGDVYVRVAAIGQLRGPWATPTTTPQSFGTPPDLPYGVASISATLDNATPQIDASWPAAQRADDYLVEVLSDSGGGVYDVLELSDTTATTSITFGSSDISSAGGPWSSVAIRITPRNTAGDGPSYTKIFTA